MHHLLLIICIFISNVGYSQVISFSGSKLDLNELVDVGASTFLQFGPDGRLYVAERYGNIYALSIQKVATDNYVVTSSETISLVNTIPNHQDDGTSTNADQRQCTALYVLGTSENPIIYASSSDPRVGGPSGDKDLDTNSGIITKLSWNGNVWEAVDIVRGLPRSEENHGPHGLEYAIINSVPHLLLAQGGHTNAGSPSINFAWANEYALSAAILAIDLNQIESLGVKTDPESGRKYVYDLPTLDDPTRANLNGIEDPSQAGYNGIDIHDPWGGNDGLNQAKYDPAGPVKILSPGFRNCYDLVVTENDAIYIAENGANEGWGGFPENEGLGGNATNNYRPGEPGSDAIDNNEEPVDNQDHLELVTNDLQNYVFGSYYGGHPNPTRSNPNGAGLFTKGTHSSDPGDSNNNGYTDDWFRTQILSPTSVDFSQKSLPADWPPYPASLANVKEGDFRNPTKNNPDGPNDQNVLIWPNNTNGIDEYTASTFGGQMKGNLIAGNNKGGRLHRVELNTDGSISNFTADWITGFGGNALGITCNGDDDVFPGTIWVASFNGEINVFEPKDGIVCILPGENGYDPNADNDLDGYTNQDEIDNGTNICFPASKPDDFDNDKISNLNDPDDDGDGIADSADPFQLGSPFDLPVTNELFSDQLLLKGYLGLGLTGLMNNGANGPNYLDWLDDPGATTTDSDDILGGAVGGMTIYHTEGDAFSNNQEKAFQYGVNVDENTNTFIVNGRMIAPFYSHSPTESQGIFIGDGFQDDYLKLVLSGNTLVVAGEVAGSSTAGLPTATIGSGFTTLDLYFIIDPVAGTAQMAYAKDGSPTKNTIGNPIFLSGKLLSAVQNPAFPLAVGIIGTADEEDGFASNWDYLNVFSDLIPADLSAIFRVNAGGPTIPSVDGGIAWVSDINATLDINRFTVNTGSTYESPANVWGPNVSSNIQSRTPFSIFNTERFDFSSGEEMKYTFDVEEAGNYRVRLYLREGYIGTSEPGSRVFTVVMDGSIFPSLKDIDLNSLVGFKTATFIEVDVTTPDNLIELEFIHYVQNPVVSGIEILSETDSIPSEAKNLPLFRVNAGGPNLPSLDGYMGWVSDDGATLGENKFEVNTGNKYAGAADSWDPKTPKEITNSTPFEVFATERFDFSSGEELKYTFDVGNQGDYLVRLYMRNAYIGTAEPGKRIFNVEINGNQIGSLTNIDLSADPGHKIGKVFEVPVTTISNLLEIEFIHVVENPLICGIEILTNEEGDSVSHDPLATWTSVPTTNDHIARHECSFIQTGTNFYMLGGRESPQIMERYNIFTSTWDKVASAPKPFNHFQAVEHEGLIWVICAFVNNNFPNELPADHIHMYDPTNDEWIQGGEIPETRRRGGPGIALHDNKFYIVGGNTDGHDGGYVSWFDVYDPATGEWTQLQDAPHQRDHFHSVIVDNKLYLSGGRLSGGLGGVFSPLVAEIDVYDFETNQWSTVSDLPTPRAGTSSVAFNDEIIVVGGEGNGQAYATTEAYNPTTNQWRNLPDMLSPRHGTQALVSGEGIFITAGSPKQGGGNQTNMEVFGENNPVGIQNVGSDLQLPASVSMSPGETKEILLTAINGNTGIFVKNILVSGADAGSFSLGDHVTKNFLLQPNTSIPIFLTLESTFQGNTDADLIIEYGDGKSETVELKAQLTTSCTGTDIPFASFVKEDVSITGADDGSITFTFPDDADNGGIREQLLFSLDGGATFPYSISDDAGSFTINNLSPDTYDLWVSWENEECIQPLGNVTILEGKAVSEIANLVLVNSISNQELIAIEDGGVINLSTYPNPLNIVAKLSNDPSFTVESVFLNLEGPLNLTRVEGVAPYALGGDSGGNYANITLPIGSYTLTAIAYSQKGAKGTAGTPKQINFTIIDQESDPCENGVPTVNAGEDIQLSCGQPTTVLSATASEGGTFNWTGPGGFTESGPNVTITEVGSYTVTFTNSTGCTNSDQVIVSQELFNPSVSIPSSVTLDCTSGVANINSTVNGYTTLSWSGPGGFQSSNENIVVSQAGVYTLTLGGGQGCLITYQVTVADCQPVCTVSEVSQLIIVNAETNEDAFEIIDGMTIYLGDIDHDIAIRAEGNACSFPIKSIKMDLTGQEDFSRTEGKAPYALFGDSGGNFSPWDAEAGNYSLVAIPYSSGGAGGTEGVKKEVNFTISNGNDTGNQSNNPPSVSVVSSKASSSISIGDDVTFTATALDVDGTISKVSFYNGNNLLQVDNAPPYVLTIANIQSGSYYIYAIAEDDDGDQGNSTNISFTLFEEVPGCQAVFNEENGLVVLEAERTQLADGWVLETDIPGYTGNGYIKWDGNNSFGTPGNGLITYKIQINNPGTYRMNWRSRIATGANPTEHNDSWLRFDDADDFFGQKSDGSTVYPKGSGKTPNPNGSGSDGWFKLFMNEANTWFWGAFTSDHDAHSIYVRFDFPGIYNMEISGRSQGHAIDRIILYNEAVSQWFAQDLSQEETLCDSPAPQQSFGSLADNLITFEVSLLPNRTSLRTNVFLLGTEMGRVNTEVIDVHGRRVLVAKCDKESYDQRHELNISGLSTGMYWVRTSLNGVVKINRLMIE
ncbi:MAG: malectin domain-containing carbohydrate-binding protein [Bacteroidota bacterium]